MGETERRRRRVRPSSTTAESSSTTAESSRTTAESSRTTAAESATGSSAVAAGAHPGLFANAGTAPRATEAATAGTPGAGTRPPSAPRAPGDRPVSGTGAWRPGRIPARPVAPRPTAVDPVAKPPAVEERDPERGLRGLVGSGASQVSLDAALRARDAARPSDEQVAEAKATLVIVRRNWLPRDELPRR